MARFLVVAVMFIAPLAQAGWRDVGKTKIFCEHYLTGSPRMNAIDEMFEQIFERPFVFSALHEVRPAALKFLKLDQIEPEHLDRLVMSLSVDEVSLSPLTFRLQLFANGKLLDVYHQDFPDSSPTFWKIVYLEDDEVSLSHSEIAARFPLPLKPDIKSGTLGFSTDPSLAGIRAYVTTHEYRGEIGTARLELGLDVPCADIEEYLDLNVNFLTDVLTNVTKYCRIPVLEFMRPTKSAE